MEHLTADNADELMLEYFSVEPYNLTWDDRGKPVLVPCDVPTVSGFCSRWGVTPDELSAMVACRTVELCRAKFEHIMVVNGSNRAYDAGFSGLAMKNLAGWSDKAEVKTVREMVLSDGDRRMLARAGVMTLDSGDVDDTGVTLAASSELPA